MRLIDWDGVHEVGLLSSDPYGLRTQAAQGSECAVRSSSAALISSALLSLDGHAGAVHLLPPDMDAPLDPSVTLLRPNCETADPAHRDATDREARTQHPTSWIVYTSGTTGTPKPVRHSLSTLARTAKPGDRYRDLVWGLVYDPNRMAGLQVLLQAIVAGSTVVAPDPHSGLVEKLHFMRTKGVDALSATPTLWRQILLSGAAEGWPLQRITLGGEIADQRILDSLHAAFPNARITHIFASTETGAAFGVHDGRAGFPASYLDEPPQGIRLRVVNGMLEVHSPGVSTAGSDGFAATGDVVEHRGDRVYFLGRDSGVVNVGGAKVWPEQVEQLLRTHPDVLDAVVGSAPNAFSGSILTAEVVARPNSDLSGRALRGWVKARAPLHHVPAMIKIVDSLGVSGAGKAARR